MNCKRKIIMRGSKRTRTATKPVQEADGKLEEISHSVNSSEMDQGHHGDRGKQNNSKRRKGSNCLDRKELRGSKTGQTEVGNNEEQTREGSDGEKGRGKKHSKDRKKMEKMTRMIHHQN